MIVQTLTIARTTFIEAVRQPVLLLMVLASGLLQIFNTWSTGFAMGQEETSEVIGDNKLLLDIGLATVFVFGTLLAGFLATAVMSREIENKTVLTIISKPVARPTLVFGKFLGVSGAILSAMVVMLVYLLFCIRHGVMSTASDELDGPVLMFALGGAAISLLLAGWCNFFYGWNFPQTAMLMLVPASLLGYAGVLLISKKWGVQSPAIDFKPQITMACICLTLAVMVLSSVATAASTRLGQVMTIVVCFGVFVASLLNNYLIGRHVFRNQLVGMLIAAKPDDPTKAPFDSPENSYTVEFENPPRPMPPGTAFYYSPSPNGYPMMGREKYVSFTGDASSIKAITAPGVAPAVVVSEGQPPYKKLKIRNIGANEKTLPVYRAPEPGDYVFAEYTRINPGALAAWGALPNLQYYWLLDAISQNRPVSFQYFATAVAYSLAQVGVFLSVAVLLFQKRDVG
ncbi:MAG: ABC transporter permease [Planctomycetes bacterium]|nr:ABC transporter permease [Planctomycetota bacterium]